MRQLPLQQFTHKTAHLANKRTYSFLLILFPTCLFIISCNTSTLQDTEDEIDTISQKAESVMDNLKEEYVEYRDDIFVKRCIKDNDDELHLLSLAINKATNKEIKRIAKNMRDDHDKLGTSLRTYAANHSIDFDISYKVSNMILDNITPGIEWDQAWIDKIIMGHEKAIDKFEYVSIRTQDRALKMLIDNFLPILQLHLDMAKELQSHEQEY